MKMPFRRRPRLQELAFFVACVLALFVVVAFASEALARPGSGQSYSGSSKSSSSSKSGSSGDSGSADLIFFLLQICFSYPQIGIPLLVIAVVVLVISKRKEGGSDWSTQSATQAAIRDEIDATGETRATSLRRRLVEALTQTDPAFSLVVFEDFAYFLYAEVQRARGEGKIDFLAPYVDERVRAFLRGNGDLRAVSGVIIGAIYYEDVDVQSGDGTAENPGFVSVRLVMDVNYVEHARAGGDARFFAKERMTLVRSLAATSRTPDKVAILACPNCGAPLSSMRGTTCAHCNTVITPGKKDWAVQSLEVLERETRGPLLTSNVDERGTNLPTVFDPQAQAGLAHLSRKDPAFSWPKLEARTNAIFQNLQAGWTARDPSKVRPFMSDNLFQSQVYFIEAYRAAHVVNRLDNSAITRIELARVSSDAFYDAITLRIHASGLDFTVSEDGKVLSGSPNKPRQYSEYWTLIRGVRASTKPTDDRACPNCGAPLQISMVGNCNYCRAKVTSGEFDWVLSRIEQDEAYRG